MRHRNINLNTHGERMEIEHDGTGVTILLVSMNLEAEVYALPQFAAVAGRCLIAASGEKMPPDLTIFPTETRTPQQIAAEDYPLPSATAPQNKFRFRDAADEASFLDMTRSR